MKKPLSGLPVAFLVTSGERIEICSSAFARLARRPAIELEGARLETVLPVVPPDDASAVVQLCVWGQPSLPCLVKASRLDESRRGFVVEQIDPDVFRRQFENAPVGMTQLSIGGRFMRVNRAFCELVGYSESELIGRFFHDLTHPEDLVAEMALLRRVLDGVQPGYTIEKRLVRKNGQLLWVQRSMSLERTAAGAPDFLLSAVVDVTARAAAEHALLRSASQLTTAQRVARIGSWELDLPSGSLQWSDEIFRIFELDRLAFGASYDAFLERVHPDDRARVDAAYLSSVRERGSYDLTHRLLMDDGRVKYVREVGETFFADDGRPVRSVGTVQDVTEQRSTELGLQDRELRLSTILSTIRDVVVLLEVEGDSVVIAEVNRAGLQRLEGYLPNIAGNLHRQIDLTAVAGALVGRISAVGKLKGLLAQVLAEGKVKELELDASPISGGLLHTEVTLTPVKDEAGRYRQVLLVSRDVTARKKAEQLLRASLVEKETLLAEVHHRVKNNLQIISSMLSLQGTGAPDAPTEGLLEEARNRIHTMALVHEQLYRTHDFASVNLAEHIQSLATMVAQSQAQRLGHVLCCELEPVSVSLDQAIPLGLVLNELLSNAWKHAFRGRSGGSVTVRCQAEGEAVRVQVADDGVGLPTEQTLEGARSLGFRLVRTLVQQLRATLSIDRASGTCITIVVPMEPGAA